MLADVGHRALLLQGIMAIFTPSYVLSVWPSSRRGHAAARQDYGPPINSLGFTPQTEAATVNDSLLVAPSLLWYVTGADVLSVWLARRSQYRSPQPSTLIPHP